jgi:hypothetical protein
MGKLGKTPRGEHQHSRVLEEVEVEEEEEEEEEEEGEEEEDLKALNIYISKSYRYYPFLHTVRDTVALALMDRVCMMTKVGYALLSHVYLCMRIYLSMLLLFQRGYL